MSAAEQVLIRDMRTIDIRINNVDAFFREAELNGEVDPNTFYELMESNGREITALVEGAYVKFRTAEGA